MRRTERYPIKGPNSLWQLYSTIGFWRVFFNTLVIVMGDIPLFPVGKIGYIEPFYG